jgi:hypothetical protein
MRAVKAWRVTISDVINMHLERAGLAERLHPDRLEDQGIARKPEPKLLPSESRDYRDTGIVSATMAEVLTIRAERKLTRAEEQASAHDYWEGRKSELGLTDAMNVPARLVVICEARGVLRDHAPAKVVAARDHEHGDMDPEGYDGARQAHAERSMEDTLAAMLRQLEAMQDDSDGHGGPLRVRLWERDDARERGHGRGELSW